MDATQGIWTRPQLESTLTHAEIAELLERGALTRVNRRYYADDSAQPDVRVALELGGRATCISALLAYGAWNPFPQGQVPLHLSPVRTHRHTYKQSHRRITAHRVRRVKDFSGPVASLEMAIHDAAYCLSPQHTHVVLESLLTNRIVSRHELDQIMSGLPARIVRQIGRVTSYSGSGSESLLARDLWARGVQFSQQKWIKGVGRVDFLVGDWLIIEIDSAQFHSSPTQVMNDRHRDFAARASGYTVLRYSWKQVHFEWEAVRAEISMLLKKRVHRKPAKGALTTGRP